MGEGWEVVNIAYLVVLQLWSEESEVRVREVRGRVGGGGRVVRGRVGGGRVGGCTGTK